MKVTCTCGTEFEARSAKARYCSDRCRKRKGKADVLSLPPRPESGDDFRGAVESAAAAELASAGRLDTSIGQACLALARRLDTPGLDTGSALAAVAGRFDDLMAKATKGAGPATAPQQLRDQLAERRARHA